MLRLPRRTLLLPGVVFFALVALTSKAATPSDSNGLNASPALVITGPGKGSAPLGGARRFHLGDYHAMAQSETADSTGTSDWEKIGGDEPWGGEIFSVERLHGHFKLRPNATEATQAAVNFGQDDNITALMPTRFASSARSTTELTIPSFAPALAEDHQAGTISMNAC